VTEQVSVFHRITEDDPVAAFAEESEKVPLNCAVLHQRNRGGRIFRTRQGEPFERFLGENSARGQ